MQDKIENSIAKPFWGIIKRTFVFKSLYNFFRFLSKLYAETYFMEVITRQVALTIGEKDTYIVF